MGRGKIEIRLIENTTNRQVTYSKRRCGILKKARELTVLCDAQVCLLMMSNTRKFFDYCSPATNMKTIFDRYQQASGNDLWEDPYQRMQDNLAQLKKTNSNLRRQIRQRMGEDLDDLAINELRGLEQDLDSSLKAIRDRKYHMIGTQTDTYKKKFKSSQEVHRSLLRQLEQEDARLDYGYVDHEAGDYEAALHLANGGTHMFAFPVQPNQPNLHQMGYNSHELRLA